MKNSWKRRFLRTALLCSVALALISRAAALQDDSSVAEDKHANTLGSGESTLVQSAPKQSSSPSLSSRARKHSRQRRQVFDGWRFTDLFRIFNSGALEGVDTMLRSTRNLDVFQCLERLSCEMAAPLRNAGGVGDFGNFGNFGGVGGGGGGGGIGSVFNPQVADEGHLADEGHAEEHHSAEAQQPAAATPQIFQPGQFAPPAFPQFVQPGYPGYPYFPQPFVPQPYPYVPSPYVGYPQYVQPQLYYPPVPGQGHQAKPAEDAHAAPTGHAPAHMPMHAPAGAHHPAATLKRSDEVHDVPAHNAHPEAHQERAFAPSFFQGYRDRMRHRQEKRNWFRRMLGKPPRRRFGRDVSHVLENAKILHRHRRGIMDTLQRLWGGKEFVGVLDRMMEGTGDSIYPYTRAALMGYTGSHETCEQLYPECPTTMDEVIDTFNNLRSHFPNGVPFRDRIPAPFRYLIP